MAYKVEFSQTLSNSLDKVPAALPIQLLMSESRESDLEILEAR